MSKQILFLKTIVEYIFIYSSSLSSLFPGVLKDINKIKPIWLFVTFIFSAIILLLSKVLNDFIYLLIILLAILEGFLKTYQSMITLRYTMLYFSAVNVYNYKPLAVLVNLTDPVIKLIDNLLPRVSILGTLIFLNTFQYWIKLVKILQKRLAFAQLQLPCIYVLESYIKWKL